MSFFLEESVEIRLYFGREVLGKEVGGLRPVFVGSVVLKILSIVHVIHLAVVRILPRFEIGRLVLNTVFLLVLPHSSLFLL